MKQTDLKHFMNTSKSIQKLVGFLGVWTLLLSAISSSTTVASSLNPLAEDGGAIPPDSPAVAVSALESSVKGIYKKSEPFYDCRVLVDWLWLWFTIIVFGTSPYVLNHSQQMPKDVGALVKCCEYCEKAGVPIWQTPLTCEAVHAKFSMQSRDLITTEPWSCQWLCMCQRTRAFIFAMLLSSSAMDNLLLLC